MAPNPSVGSIGDQLLEDDVDLPTHRARHRVLENADLSSSSLGMRAPGEVTSGVGPIPLSLLTFFL